MSGRCCFILFLGLMLATATGASAGAARITAADRAFARASTGDLAGAIVDLRTFLAVNPADATAQRVLGDLYFRTAQPREAERAWQRELRIDPGDAIALMRLGAMYVAQNRLTDAINAYDAIEPSQATIGALVRLHTRALDLARFLDTTAQAAQSHPGDADAQWREANVLQYLHRYDDALTLYTDVVRLRGATCGALLGRAGVLIALQRSDDARADLQRCLQREPASYGALVAMGGIEIAADRIDAAREWVDRALDANPNGVDALIDRAFCEDARGERDLAMRDNRLAIALDPTRYEGYANVAFDLLDDRAPSAAETTLRDGLRADPRNGRLHFLLARAYELEERPAATVRAEYTAALGSDEEVIVRAADDALHR
jgi:tetratricopeptide (TPR) repeat protein